MAYIHYGGDFVGLPNGPFLTVAAPTKEKGGTLYVLVNSRWRRVKVAKCGTTYIGSREALIQL